MIWQKRRKYGNKPVAADGIKFDSTAEFRRWADLMILQRAAKISHLEVHPRFRLEVNGQHICDYIGDFAYFHAGKRVVEDVKSTATANLPAFRLKRKLMMAIYGVEIRLTGKGVNP